MMKVVNSQSYKLQVMLVTCESVLDAAACLQTVSMQCIECTVSLIRCTSDNCDENFRNVPESIRLPLLSQKLRLFDA
jgi:hypothetical protein